MPTERPVAVVTGSNRGIGREIALELSGAGGYLVVSNARGAPPGSGDLHVKADVSTPAGARKLVSATKKRFGRLDLLVCNVGDFDYTPVSEFDTDRWESILASNLRTVWHPCREALPLLRKSRGQIVTLGGPVTQTVRGNPRAVAYQMAKTALTVFTKSLAQSEARHGVRVNMINPGFIRTYAYSKKEIAEATRKVPAGRIGEPRDIARLVRWLALNETEYVNGAVIDVGGGLWV
jgi:3-oxoacyl-[acyl-carrier protein] reductase